MTELKNISRYIKLYYIHKEKRDTKKPIIITGYFIHVMA